MIESPDTVAIPDRCAMELIRLCWLNRHAPDRKQASWDGENYVGTCRKCSKPIRRFRKGVWKFDRTDQQAQPDAP